MEKVLIASRFAQALPGYDDHAIVQRQVASELLDLIRQHVPQRHIKRVFEIGCGSGVFTRSFLAHFNVDTVFLNDLYTDIKAHFPSDQRIQWNIGDIEQIVIPQSLNLVVSSSALQWIHNPPRLFAKVHGALQASHYFCFASYAQNNFKEIKSLTGQGLDYLSLNEIHDLIVQQQFKILHQSETMTQLLFDHPKEILRHIKNTGVHATGQGFRWTRATLERFCQAYCQYQQPETGRYPLTYHPIFIIAQKPL